MVAHDNAPFVRQAKAPRRPRCSQVGNAGEWQPTLMVSGGEQHVESGFGSRNSAPHAKKTGIGFHFRRRRRMVRGYAIYHAAQHCRPQFFMLMLVAKRWRALSCRANPLDVFFSKEEVMRTGFNRDVYTSSAGFTGFGHATS